MTFKLVDYYDEIKSGDDGYYLIHSNWDDWFKYETTYSFYIKKDVSIINVWLSEDRRNGDARKGSALTFRI